MKKFKITIIEHIEVEGETEDEAFENFNNGKGETVFDNTEIEEIE